MKMKIQHSKMWGTAKAVLKGKFIALSAHIRKEEKYPISRTQEKKNKIKPKQAMQGNNRDKNRNQ